MPAISPFDVAPRTPAMCRCMNPQQCSRAESEFSPFNPCRLRRSAPFVGQINGGPPTPPSVNPKEVAGSKKPPVWSVMPRWVVTLVGRVMALGAAKYGRFNYRETRIAASTYEDAMERHAQLWFDGEDNDPESGVSHLAHIMAGCALLLDAQQTGKLDDDRQKTGTVRKQMDELAKIMAALPLPVKS